MGATCVHETARYYFFRAGSADDFFLIERGVLDYHNDHCAGSRSIPAKNPLKHLM